MKGLMSLRLQTIKPPPAYKPIPAYKPAPAPAYKPTTAPAHKTTPATAYKLAQAPLPTKPLVYLPTLHLINHYLPKVRFSYQCSDHLSHSKNFTSLFPLTFLSKHISLYALGRLKWILDIIWPLNQHFKLKNQRNWLKQVRMWKFWNVMNCILLHW